MDPVILIFSLIILLFSIIIHELAHGYVAFSLGDSTAKYAGRLTLNPIKHLDPFGSVILPLLLFISGSSVLFGWAKPVPINPYNLRDQRWGSLKVAIAGPISNMSLALLFGLMLRFMPYEFLAAQPGILIIFSFIIRINIILALFNLLPIPPLDGSWVLFNFIPDQFNAAKLFLQQYGIFILIFLIFFGGLFWLYAIENFLFTLFTGIT